MAVAIDAPTTKAKKTHNRKKQMMYLASWFPKSPSILYASILARFDPPGHDLRQALVVLGPSCFAGDRSAAEQHTD
jgi:hypothetical protein